MMNQSRRSFFKSVIGAGAALAASGAIRSTPVEAAEKAAIVGVCLYVPALGKAADFVAEMNQNAPGSWSVQPLEGSLTERYFQTRESFQAARDGAGNTFVGVVDPATFALVHEAIVDSGGSFHYVKHEEHDRVTFSVQV